jgi:HJR/Mrr/RecB family endonuclease
MADRDKEYDERLPWESDAWNRIRGLLYEATLDREQGSVTLYSEDWGFKGDKAPRTFWNFDDLRDTLIKIGDETMIGSVPWEGGAVFDTDSEHLVDAALEAAGVQHVFALALPDDSDLLISLDDICQPHRAEEIRLTLEEVNDLLIEALAQNPDLMHEIHPRRFEELVAELFKRMGCEVTLTPQSRDGGRDVLAIRRDDVGTLLTLVECKKFRPDRRVGVALVRSLYGVVRSDRASHGVIATTSSFTRGAKEFQQNLQYHLSLRSFDDLVAWCRKYRSSEGRFH